MNYVVAVLAALIGSLVVYKLGLPLWPALAVFLIGYTGGRVAGHFARE